jgi:hypothetical protein
MGFRLEDNVISIEGDCSVEEAEPLFEMLRDVEAPVFDLSRATGLHTAIIQVVLASGARVRGVPADKVLAACLRTCQPA